MKKICLIVALLLALVDANAQWKWKEKRGSGWRSESTSFHRGKEMNGIRYTDRSSGTSYGFIGGYDGQVRRDYSRRRSYSAEADQWSSINADDKSVAKRNAGVWSESRPRPAERPAARSYGGSLLSRNVWVENHHGRSRVYSGGGDAVDYGRRVKPQGAPDNYNMPNAMSMKIDNVIKETPAVASNEEYSRSALGQDNGGAAGGQYGFGEVPKDDAPVGDGLLVLLFFVALTTVYKIYHQDFN